MGEDSQASIWSPESTGPKGGNILSAWVFSGPLVRDGKRGADARLVTVPSIGVACRLPSHIWNDFH